MGEWPDDHGRTNRAGTRISCRCCSCRNMEVGSQSSDFGHPNDARDSLHNGCAAALPDDADVPVCDRRFAPWRGGSVWRCQLLGFLSNQGHWAPDRPWRIENGRDALGIRRWDAVGPHRPWRGVGRGDRYSQYSSQSALRRCSGGPALPGHRRVGIAADFRLCLLSARASRRSDGSNGRASSWMIVELKQYARPFGLRRGSLRENRERTLNFASWNRIEDWLRGFAAFRKSEEPEPPQLR